jgi:arginyl-tRNA synthetase
MHDVSLQDQLAHIATGLAGEDSPPIQLERPRDPSHGDLATNLALVLAGRLKQPPRQVAEHIIATLDLAAAGIASAQIAGPGFINFRLAHETVHGVLSRILTAGEDWGRTAQRAGRRTQVEFVSANPTGPLHVAHGRGAALGDAIASLLEWQGEEVTREFYVNDAGAQIDRLAESLDARWRQLHGETAQVPEGGYHGEYLVDMAKHAEAEQGDALRAASPAERVRLLRAWAIARLRAEQDADLRDFGVHFDVYTTESELYASPLLDETLRALVAQNLTYQLDGAVWLRTSEYGDDKDRVLVKSDGTYTYFLPDLAYHREKARRGFHHVINVWGADHHGYVPRMQAALAAIELRGFLDIEIVQMVRVMRGTEEVKLSKRAGTIVTLRELIAETGVDVARYFFLMRRGDAQMLFDLDLALDHSEKNPIYKVQYAHARMMSIFRKAGEDPAALRVADVDPGLLTHGTELELMKQMAAFPDALVRASAARAPHIVCDYLETTAGLVNSWYHAGNPSRNPALAVLVADPALRRARLVLARAIQIVLRNGLRVLGLGAPDRMEREEAAA